MKEQTGPLQQGSDDRSEQRKTLEQNVAEGYRYFLEHGYLPWWMATASLAEIETLLLEGSGDSTWLEELKQLFLRNQKAVQRFARQASPAFFQQVWEKWKPAGLDAATETAIPLLFKKVMSAEQAALYFREALIAYAVQARPGRDALKSMVFLLLEKSDVQLRYPAILPIVEKTFHRNIKVRELPPSEMDPKEPEYHVNQAGIVLLSPFLSAFFENIGLTKDHHFVSVDKQETAVGSLHYMCTGSQICPENEALMYKLMCGIPLEQPIPMNLNATEELLQEADTLLSTVIDHWSALKSTSPHGLREGFLQRSGKLLWQNQQWQLIVERRVQDILLDQLPWGFSVIKNPWMKDILRVEW